MGAARGAPRPARPQNPKGSPIKKAGLLPEDPVRFVDAEQSHITFYTWERFFVPPCASSHRAFPIWVEPFYIPDRFFPYFSTSGTASSGIPVPIPGVKPDFHLYGNPPMHPAFCFADTPRTLHYKPFLLSATLKIPHTIPIFQ